jgi:hypothetical protein
MLKLKHYIFFFLSINKISPIIFTLIPYILTLTFFYIVSNLLHNIGSKNINNYMDNLTWGYAIILNILFVGIFFLIYIKLKQFKLIKSREIDLNYYIISTLMEKDNENYFDNMKTLIPWMETLKTQIEYELKNNIVIDKLRINKDEIRRLNREQKFLADLKFISAYFILYQTKIETDEQKKYQYIKMIKNIKEIIMIKNYE